MCKSCFSNLSCAILDDLQIVSHVFIHFAVECSPFGIVSCELGNMGSIYRIGISYSLEITHHSKVLRGKLFFVWRILYTLKYSKYLCLRDVKQSRHLRPFTGRQVLFLLKLLL